MAEVPLESVVANPLTVQVRKTWGGMTSLGPPSAGSESGPHVCRPVQGRSVGRVLGKGEKRQVS